MLAVFIESRHLIQNHLYLRRNCDMEPALVHPEYFLVFINYSISALNLLKDCALPHGGSTTTRLFSVSNDDIPRIKVFHIFVFGFQIYPWYTDSRRFFKSLSRWFLLSSWNHERRSVIILSTRFIRFQWPLLLAKWFLYDSLNLLWGKCGLLRTLKSQMGNVMVRSWGSWMRQ